MKLDETGLKYVLSLLKVRTPKQIYPVGSIYMSVNSTNPSNLFGGTWEQIQDTFLLASGSTYTAGATGGSADAVLVKHTHTPSMGTDYGFATYKHDSGVGRAKVMVTNGNRYAYCGKTGATSADASGLAWSTYLGDAGSTDGTGQNMPPYLAVYVWKRVA